MFRLDVFQNQWLVFALAGGLAIVLCLALYYVAMWRERPDPTASRPGEAADRPRRFWFPPALLLLTYALILVFAVAYTLMAVWRPPNW